jgi:hypothetical protein
MTPYADPDWCASEYARITTIFAARAELQRLAFSLTRLGMDYPVPEVKAAITAVRAVIDEQQRELSKASKAAEEYPARHRVKDSEQMRLRI